MQAMKYAEQLALFKEKHSIVTLKPEKAALLIIDMQDFFLSEKSHAYVPSMKAIVPKLKNLQDCFLQNNLTVIQTKHSNTVENAGQMMSWWGAILTPNDPMVRIIPELADSRIPIIPKSQYDAFCGTDLEQKLRDDGIEQVIIGGVMTHLCCESTARAAFFKDFDVFFIIDGVATYNEQFHFNTLYNLAHGFATMVLSEEILSRGHT
jgi:bifunctional isochorismate lyase/aryl carrier protein